MRTGSFKARYRARTKRSLCAGKNKTKCSKVRGCKYVKGATKSYCRKQRSKKVKISTL